MNATGDWYGLPHPFPFALAIVSVTALVAANPNEGIQFGSLRDPVIAALFLVLISWLTAALYTRDGGRRALIAAAVSLPVLTSGYAFRWLRSAALGEGLRAGIELGVIASVVLTAVVLIGKKNPPSQRLLGFLNTSSTLLLLFTLPAVWTLRDVSLRPVEGNVVATDVDPEAARPDIYLIVVDEYTGTNSLQRFYGYDNSLFIDTLRSMGFAIPAEQRSNYIKTVLSVGAMLNRSYVSGLDDDRGEHHPSLGRQFERLELNRTVRDLKALGYEFAYVGSSYPPLAGNRLADRQYGQSLSRDFEALWIWMTAFPPTATVVCRVVGCDETVRFAESSDITEARLSYLNGLVDLPGPKFVYAHWLLPHGPYRFGPNCEPRGPRWVFGPNRIAEDSVDRRMYIEQLECTNRKLLEFVDVVLAADGDMPVIILQADHGHGRYGRDPPALSEAQPDQVVERFDVFAAYAGPGSLADSLAAVRSPVNLFRTLFRVQWGVNEPPLPDESYWSDPQRPLLLERVDFE